MQPQSRAQWERVADAFHAVLDSPAGERADRLAEVCADDAALRREVEALLDAHATSTDFLDGLDAGHAAALLEDAPKPLTDAAADEDVPARVGPYRPLREVGRGGMGRVFAAERADGAFEQRVALKLVKRGMDSDAILARFLQERQILARLHHAHIARLYDGGVTDEGQPFFAMEFVEGVPLTDYCDRHRLPLEARLRLFTDVCGAVHHAHRNLVVHRDLKPSNILVAEGDGARSGQGAPRVKLLDFGIAKVLSEDADAPVTRADLRVLTPEYAAPEQVLDGPITTATDVYALGVLLYELLTGERPYRFEEATPSAIARALAETDPERPSTAARRATAEVATARRLAPDRLPRRLRGDLDTIVLKALRREPEQRYASAEALLDDVERHLAGLPVQARPATLRYRAATFVRRHRLGVAMAAALALLLVGFSVAMAVQTAQIRAQAEELAAERDRAEATTAFLERLFTASDPAVEQGEPVTARQLLDEGAGRIEADLAGQPEVQARLWGTVGRVYASLGLHEDAHAMLRRSVDRLRALHPEGHPLLVENLVALGRAARDLPQPDYAEALALHQEAVGWARRLYEPPHQDLAHSLFALGGSFSMMGRGAEAQPLLHEAKAQFEALPSAADADYADVLASLGQYAFAAGNPAEADSLHRQALAVRRALYGDDHPDVVAALHFLGSVLGELDRYEDAVAALDTALATAHRIYDADNDALSVLYHTLGVTHHQHGHYAEAIAAYQESLRIAGLHHSGPYYLTALTRYRLGVAQHRAGRPAEALASFDDALPALTTLFGAESSWVLTARLSRSASLRALGRLPDAVAELEAILPPIRATLPPDNIAHSATLVELGDAYVELGRPDEALPLLREGYALYQAHASDRPERIARAQHALGLALTQTGDAAEARAMLTSALAFLWEQDEPHHTERRASAERALASLPPVPKADA